MNTTGVKVQVILFDELGKKPFREVIFEISTNRIQQVKLNSHNITA
jgi:hypothetical protein